MCLETLSSTPGNTVGGEIYKYEHRIEQVNKGNLGTYGCNMTLDGESFHLEAGTINVYDYNVTSKRALVQVNGQLNTLTCFAEHPAITDNTLVYMTWYKSLDIMDSRKEYSPSMEASHELQLTGKWADSAKYRCLVEFANPYIPGVWSETLDVAYVGIYRTSMYRYNTEATEPENKLILTKIASKNLELSCYIQTGLRDSITGAEWTIDGQTPEPELDDDGNEIPQPSIVSPSW